MSEARSTPTSTLGAALERDRLEYRVNRITIAITALREREDEGEQRGRRGTPQRHLRRAIADFEAQVDAMNGRLRALGG